MTGADLLPPAILKRKAVVYVRQSTQAQVQLNLESQRRQYELVDEARRRGFRDVEVIDDDRGRSASGTVARGVAVALDDAPIIVEQLQAMDRSAAGRLGVGDRRRVRSAPRPIVAGDRPEIAALDPTAARIEHRRLRLVDRDLGRGQDEFAKAVVDRPELRGRGADPERQRRALDVEPLSSQHLGLTIDARRIWTPARRPPSLRSAGRP